MSRIFDFAAGRGGVPVDSIPAGAVFVLGNFDGVHRGHRALFQEAVRLAAELSPACPPPIAAWSLSGLRRDGVLTTEEEKCLLFRHNRAKYAVFEEFSEVRGLSGEEFFRDRLLALFHPAAVVCGFNFTFGRGASCGPEALSAFAEAAGIRAAVCPPVTEGDAPISSTRIREAVRRGEMAEAARLMGHPYPVTGEVLHGQALGRTLGLPTLNQRLPEGKIAPPRGVYACCARYESGGRPVLAPGVANLGSRPTVNGDPGDVTLETHLIGDCGDLYGVDLVVWLGEFLRPEKKFASLDELKEAVAADEAAAFPARERLYSGYGGIFNDDDLLL